jgi:hypothetical protein
MQFTLRNIRLLFTFASIIFLLLLSGCAHDRDSAYQNSQSKVGCSDILEKEFECDAKVAHHKNRQDLHPEYTQQLLPIYQRREIIEQELEDVRNAHR